MAEGKKPQKNENAIRIRSELRAKTREWMEKYPDTVLPKAPDGNGVEYLIDWFEGVPIVVRLTMGAGSGGKQTVTRLFAAFEMTDLFRDIENDEESRRILFWKKGNKKGIRRQEAIILSGDGDREKVKECSKKSMYIDHIPEFLSAIQIPMGGAKPMFSYPGHYTIDDEPYFVGIDGEVYCSDKNHHGILHPAMVAKAAHTKGTLEGWKEAISYMSQFKADHLNLAPVMGLASPLIAFLGLPNCIVTLVGQSTGGKTTAQVVAGSCWGKANIEVADETATVVSMDGTVGALREMAAINNGHGVHFDELRAMGTRQDLQGFIMGMSSGSTRGRLERDNNKFRLSDQRKFHSLVTISSETDIESLIVQADQNGGTSTLLQGATARMIRIDIKAGDIPDFKTKFEAPLLSNYGYAGPMFVDAIYNLPKEERIALREKLISARAEIVKELCEDHGLEDKGTVKRIVSHFATLLVTAQFAQSREILPTDIDYDSLISDLFADYVKGADGVGTDVTRSNQDVAIERFDDQFVTNRGRLFMDLDDPDKFPANAEPKGFYKRDLRDATVTLYIPKNNLPKLVTGTTQDSFLKKMEDEGRLVRQAGNRTWRAIPGRGTTRNFRFDMSAIIADEDEQEE